MDNISTISIGFSHNIYHKGNVSKMPDFDGFFFLFWSVRNVKLDIIVNEKMATLNAKCVLKNAYILLHSFLHRIFKHKSVMSSVPNYLNNTETPIIC